MIIIILLLLIVLNLHPQRGKLVLRNRTVHTILRLLYFSLLLYDLLVAVSKIHFRNRLLYPGKHDGRVITGMSIAKRMLIKQVNIMLYKTQMESRLEIAELV